MADIIDLRHLAVRLTAHAFLAHDAQVPQIAADYWELSEPHFRRVDELLRDFLEGRPEAMSCYRELIADTCAVDPWRRLCGLLARVLESRAEDGQRLGAVVAEADRHIWIDYHLGARYARGPGPTADLNPPFAPVPLMPSDPASDVHVVIPFRDTEHGPRTRNLLACLAALADQDSGGHLVTVVEADDEPRSMELLQRLGCHYVFAHKRGLFNKSWAVNVGAAAAPGRLRYLCVLDADILVDRYFISRNVTRFTDRGHGAHLPFRWSLSLDGPSTLRAISIRAAERNTDVAADVLRGLLLRETPGGCLWVTADLFGQVGGFDERYEGWGGEDDDVVARLSAVAPLSRFDDQLLHLDHPRPAMLNGGVPFNAHIEPLSWTADVGYGDPVKFAAGPATG